MSMRASQALAWREITPWRLLLWVAEDLRARSGRLNALASATLLPGQGCCK
jgi:hypothetical protein